MKKIIHNIFKVFGLNVSRINPEIKDLSFDDIYKLKIKKKPIIFDVGANRGQSIERFKKIFDKPIIHAFEPIKFEFEKLKDKYKNDENVILNNFAVGDKEEKKEFYITAKTGTSSFNKLTPNTNWLKTRSKQFNTSLENYTKEVVEVNVITLNKYCEDNQINEIDILKIDTQGYEDKVLMGCKKILEKNSITAVETEITFDNVYEKHLSFSDLEKFLLPHNFRFCGINIASNNLFSGIVFFADLLYFNQNKINLK